MCAADLFITTPGPYDTLGPFYRPEKKRKVREERTERSNQDTTLINLPLDATLQLVDSAEAAVPEMPRPIQLSYAELRRVELKQERPMSKEETAKNLVQEALGKATSGRQYKDNLRRLLQGQFAESPTMEQINELKYSLDSVPSFLGRVYSYEHG